MFGEGFRNDLGLRFGRETIQPQQNNSRMNLTVLINQLSEIFVASHQQRLFLVRLPQHFFLPRQRVDSRQVVRVCAEISKRTQKPTAADPREQTRGESCCRFPYRRPLAVAFWVGAPDGARYGQVQFCHASLSWRDVLLLPRTVMRAPVEALGGMESAAAFAST